MSSDLVAICDACKSGDVETVKRILPLVSAESINSSNCLKNACEAGSFELVKILLSHKADPNSTKGEPIGTALHVLARVCPVSMKTVMMCDILLKAKANPELRDENNDTPLDVLKRRENPCAVTAELVKLLDRAPSPRKTQEQLGSPRKGMGDPDSPRKESTGKELGDSESPTKESARRGVERSESLKKLLEFSPIRQQASPPRKPTTPPNEESPKIGHSRVIELETENEKLRAENSALRDEVKRFRATMSKLDARQQLKELYARLIQLESIESTLEQLNYLKE